MRTLVGSTVLLACAALVSACGGGGGFGNGNGPNPPPTPTPTVASLALISSSNSLPSTVTSPDDPDAVLLTAIAKDANNNAVPNAVVAFTSTSGTLVVLTGTTDASGQATAKLHTGGDPTLRTITVTATAGGQTVTKAIQVVNPTTNPPPASLTLLTSSVQLSSNASDPSHGVTLTAIVKDASNNVISGVPVQFSTPDSGEIIVINGTTDNSGRATATVTTGGDPQNRTITITSRAGSITSTTVIQVVGTTLSISGPASTQISTPTAYVVQLNDAAGNGIAGRSVTLTTNAGNTLTPSSPVITDAGGQATVNLSATQAASTLTAAALGLTTTKSITVSTDQFTFTTPANDAEINIGTNRTVTVRWLQSGNPVPNGTVINFEITRGSVSSASATTTNGLASITISSTEAGFATMVASSPALSRPSATLEVEFVAITPFAVDVQASPSTIATNQSTDITAVVRDAANNLVKNVTVDFSLSDSTSGVLSSPTVVTNSQGTGTIRYTASSQASASHQVIITGLVRGSTGTVPAQSCPEICDTANITVGSRAVGITIGAGSVILIKDESTYQLPFSVVITDSAGNPVPDAEFRLSLVPVAFNKGTFGVDATGVFGTNFTITCPNEDVNLNDIKDPGEDVDSDGILEPGRPASVPATVPIDADGSGQFLVTYPKGVGEFLFVDLIGIASVSGTEATAKLRSLLPIAKADEDSLPGISPYGVVGNCADPN